MYLISASVGLLPAVMKEIYDSNDAHNELNPIYIGWNALGATGGLLLHYFLFDKTGNKQRVTFNYNQK